MLRSYGEPFGTTSSPAWAARAEAAGPSRQMSSQIASAMSTPWKRIDVHRVAGDEVADLVADPVVPEVVLGLAGDDLAAVDHGDGVLRRVLRPPDPRRRVVGLVEEADEREQVARGLRPAAARASAVAASRDALITVARMARSSIG